MKILIKYISGNKLAIIVLHEIYGINNFIKCICHQYHLEGYDVFCPNLLKHDVIFSYSESQKAHSSFICNGGFGIYTKVNSLINELKTHYEKVILIGFSIGATIAWRCSENTSCSGVICCYGSRIRDYLTVTPHCPAFLVFAKHDSFDVDSVYTNLLAKANTKTIVIEAEHGFIDMFSEHYSIQQSEVFNLYRKGFLTDLISHLQTPYTG